MEISQVTDEKIEQFIKDWEEVMNATQSDLVFAHAEDQVEGLRRELKIRQVKLTVTEEQRDVFRAWRDDFGTDETLRMIKVITGSAVQGEALWRACAV